MRTIDDTLWRAFPPDFVLAKNAGPAGRAGVDMWTQRSTHTNDASQVGVKERVEDYCELFGEIEEEVINY